MFPHGIVLVLLDIVKSHSLKHLSTSYSIVMKLMIISIGTFPYWALNMKLRHQLLSQSSVYIRQHPGDANLTIENLRDMVGRLSAEQLMH